MINNRQELIKAFTQGDDQAFRILFDMYWDTLYQFVTQQTGDEEQSKDIVQNAFVSLWQNRHNLVVGDSLLPYLFKITRNEIISLFRKNKVRLNGIEILVARLKTADDPENVLIAKELQFNIDLEMIKMPLSMKKCFQLSRYENKSIKDISAELSLSEQTVKNNISEAMRRLRSGLKLT
ncbi:sigma-70 family RNA polymerase sigma factor [uncultured Pedobacter sp.]|uniref:RNA polymerase sigma factor n=1 Tax=uncultured Pedobacter sp. TaxID=246139 RepID=UPI0025D0A918|nr:sigma-70 family RNA polymerase sigma factor [uncultured Pedobacter sp.]